MIITNMKYELNKKGQVFSVRSNKFLKPQLKTNGYLSVSFCENGKVKQHLVHRLVAKKYLPNPKNLPEVNHKNGIKIDNRLENLEWVSKSENEKHSYKVGLKSHLGEKNTQSKLTKEEVLQIKNFWETKNFLQKELGEMFGVCQQTISLIVINKNWKHL